MAFASPSGIAAKASLDVSEVTVGAGTGEVVLAEVGVRRDCFDSLTAPGSCGALHGRTASAYKPGMPLQLK